MILASTHGAYGSTSATAHAEPASPEAASPVASAAAVASAVANDTPQFISPITNIDPDTGIAVLVVRDVFSGEVADQYPSKQVVDEYRRHLMPEPADRQAEPTAEAGHAPAAAPVPAEAAVPAAPVAVAMPAPQLLSAKP
jgi:hypothetical protein